LELEREGIRASVGEAAAHHHGAMVFGGGYKASKLKPQLKMAVTRFQIAGNKKAALMKQQIREIAALLAETPPKEEKARIKAEALIRDDNTVEAYEILQLNCDLLSERIHLISHSKECPPDLVSCISTLIWASAVVDIPELAVIRKQFVYKYGKDFESDAMQNVGGILNERVASRLSIQPPSAFMVQTYLEKIADEHEVDWKPQMPLKAGDISEPMPAPGGYSVPVGGGSGLNPSTLAEGDPGNTAGEATAPPASPSFGVIPEAPSHGSASTVSTLSSQRQQSAYAPGPPKAAAPFAPPSNIEEVEEVDIHVPGALKPGNNGGGDDGGGGAGVGATRGKTQSAGEDSHGSAPPADGGLGDESYDDLAARFAMLQNKK